MIKALPTSIRLFNGETQSVQWGLPETSKQRETMMVGHSLKHQTAVDVSIGNLFYSGSSIHKLIDTYNHNMLFTNSERKMSDIFLICI
jgi:hypothetical protein